MISNNESIRTFKQPGIADLYGLLRQDAPFLQGAVIADKIVGKAAATLMILGNARRIYADVVSQPALDLLQDTNIRIDFGQLVPFIKNRMVSVGIRLLWGKIDARYRLHDTKLHT